ncbi:MAG TPA: phosphoribosylformylglycinamidine synthase I [Candidatus Acidoferrales bacterium]|nr:phosphoribosylformylglycinamidine synthase I [Candidatus Acidoferrales bacterium]
MKIGIIKFGGSNCDLDVYKSLTNLGISCDQVWYKESLSDFDAVIIPGGFSYGDYLRAGAIAARTEIMSSVCTMAIEGKPILGICNGAQILSEAKLVPGTFTTNAYPKFICKWVKLRVTGTSIFTNRSRETIDIPIAHKEGRYVVDKKTLQEMYDNDQVIFKYVDDDGLPSTDANPNGSIDNIAGISNIEGNVLAMMPHPERASDALLGSTDGIAIFQSMANYLGKF